MDFWKFFPLATNVLLLMLALYGLSGIIRNIFEVSTLDFKSAPWPLNTGPLNFISMLIQTIMTFGALLGMFGSLKKNATIIYCTAFFLLGTFVMYIVFGVSVIKDSTASGSNNELSHALFKWVRDHAGIDSVLYQWMCEFQYENECCGVFSYMDWKMVNMTLSILPQDSVPQTCCLRDRLIPSPGCGIDILRTNNSVDQITTVVFAEGCGPRLSQIYSKRLLGRGIELVVLGLICLLIAVFIYYAISKTYTLVTVEGNENGRGHVRLVANDDPVFLAVANRRQLHTLRSADAGDCNVTSVQSVSRSRKKQQQKLGRTSVKKFGPSSKQRKINEQRFQNKTQAPPQTKPALRKDSDSGHVSAIQTEMLLHPASDKYSTQSTCPYSSTSQNLWFRKGQPHNSDSHPNKPYAVSSTRNSSAANAGSTTSGHSGSGTTKEKNHAVQLSYYSSLPQVHIQTRPSSCHHHPKGWLSKPHMQMASVSTIAGVDVSFPMAQLNFMAHDETAQTNNNVPSFSDVSEPDTLAPTTIGVNNGNLLIMEEHEKLAPSSDVEEEGANRIIVEYLAEHVESTTNLSIIAEEDGVGVHSTTEVDQQNLPMSMSNSTPSSSSPASGTRFDDVVQAGITDYL